MTMTDSEWSWPPPYELIRSSRAKRISIKLDPAKGLCLVVPLRSSEKRALAFLDAHKVWVCQHRHWIERRQTAFVWPSTISLPALGQSFPLKITPFSGRRPFLSARRGVLYFYGDRSQSAIFTRLLKRWVIRCAKENLPPWLARWGDQTGLAYQQCAVRWMRSRWGSCSEEKRISLNAALLFHEPDLVDYVLLHELCHTLEMNHSRAFWRAVQSRMPDYRLRVTRLKKEVVPFWLL